MSKKIVLLVEDNPDDRELTLLAFEQINIFHEVVVAGNGMEALNYLLGSGEDTDRNTTEMPVLILLDLKLPKISGLEILRRLRANDLTKNIPVVILTTSKEEQDLIQGYQLGCNSYIRKPVDFAQFQNAVQQLGLYWLLYNIVPPILKV